MLEEKSVHYFRLVGNLDLFDIKKDCISDFYSKIFNLMDKTQTIGLGNYQIFNNSAKNIKYNSKNIIFSQLYTDLKEYKPQWGKEQICNINCNQATLKISEEKQKCWDNCFEYFGKGEFPYMTITIIRIGDKEYSFYTISR